MNLKILAAKNTTEQVVENRTWKKNSGPYRIWTHDLCDTGAALYQLRKVQNYTKLKKCLLVKHRSDNALIAFVI